MVNFMEAVRQLRKIKHPDEPISPAYRAGKDRRPNSQLLRQVSAGG
jgi:hypothetical protein